MGTPKRNQRIFITVFILFLAVIIFLTIDMASHTTAPWNKLAAPSQSDSEAVTGPAAEIPPLETDSASRGDTL